MMKRKMTTAVRATSQGCSSLGPTTEQQDTGTGRQMEMGAARGMGAASGEPYLAGDRTSPLWGPGCAKPGTGDAGNTRARWQMLTATSPGILLVLRKLPSTQPTCPWGCLAW